MKENAGDLFLAQSSNIERKYQLSKVEDIFLMNSSDKISKIQEIFQKKYLKSQQNSSEIYCVLVIGFHHKIGPQIEFTYPEQFQEKFKVIMPQVISYALPDLAHLHQEDYIFFNIQQNYQNDKKSSQTEKEYNQSQDLQINQYDIKCCNSVKLCDLKDNQKLEQINKKNSKLNQNSDLQQIYGLSCFKQINCTQQLKDQNEEISRNKVQKSVVVMTNSPHLWLLQEKCWGVTRAYFEQQNFENFEVLKTLIDDKNLLIQTKQGLYEVIQFLGNKLFYVLKAILMQQNILVFSHKPSYLTKFMHGLLSLLPGFFIKEKQLGIKYFSDNYQLKMYGSIYDYANINKKCNYMMATTNELIKQQFKSFVLIDIKNKEIILDKKKIKLTKFEKEIQLRILNQKKSTHEYIGSDDWIQHQIQSYLRNFYCDLALYAKLSIQNQNKEQIQKNNLLKMVGSLLSKNSFTKNLISQQNNNNYLILEKYSGFFLDEFSKTSGFKSLIKNHSPSLAHLSNQFSILTPVFISNREYLYFGHIQNGKFSDKGELIDKDSHYEGEFKDGKKEGMGKENSESSKYIGPFKNNQWSGHGLLQTSEYIYQGEFRFGKKQGSGVLIQNEKIQQGYWIQDEFQI